jgi:hypothetical protein
VKRLLMARGVKVINSVTGEVSDYVPSASTLTEIAPKVRKVTRAIAAGDAAAISEAQEDLDNKIDKVVRLKMEANITHAQAYMNHLLAKKADSVRSEDKVAAAPYIATALIQGNKKAVLAIARRLLTERPKNALEVIALNATVANALTTRAAGKGTRKKKIRENVAAAIAAVNPEEFAGYVPNANNEKRYDSAKELNALNKFAAHYQKAEVAAAIKAAIAKNATRRAAKAAKANTGFVMRNVSPQERVNAKITKELKNAVRGDIATLFRLPKENEDKIKNSNIKRLAEIRARGLDLAAYNYYKAVRPTFTVKRDEEKRAARREASVAASLAALGRSSNSNNGAAAGPAAGGAGAGAGAGAAAAAMMAEMMANAGNAAATGRRGRNTSRKLGTAAAEAARRGRAGE